MAEFKTYRVWYRNDSARLVSAASHEDAAREGQELAGLTHADIDRATPEGRKEYLQCCKVRRTECLTDGTERHWK